MAEVLSMFNGTKSLLLQLIVSKRSIILSVKIRIMILKKSGILCQEKRIQIFLFMQTVTKTATAYYCFCVSSLFFLNDNSHFVYIHYVSRGTLQTYLERAQSIPRLRTINCGPHSAVPSLDSVETAVATGWLKPLPLLRFLTTG